ncbi:hypothetical protein [Bradyrhizobium sp. STM 3809]|uniref:hypothetical protein n=1 Tax=Bradyrhizobium sp. STM 3809 TaxID=551936 RepID=UPI00024092F5
MTEIDEAVAPRATPAPEAAAAEAVVQDAEAAKTETEKTPRRSTVREKVSFVTEPKPDSTASAVNVAESSPAPIAQTPASEPVATETEQTTPAAPRRAGWWSRRFGGGQ